MFEGLELVELKSSMDASAFPGSPEHPPVEAVAMLAEQFQTASDGSACAVEDSCGLAVSDLGGEVAEELEVEARESEPVVEPEGLDGEGSEAGAAAEALDGAAVALAAEMAVETEAEPLTCGQ